MKTEEKKEKCTACKGVGSLHYIGRKYRTPCPACEGTGLELLPTPPKVEVTEERLRAAWIKSVTGMNFRFTENLRTQFQLFKKELGL